MDTQGFSKSIGMVQSWGFELGPNRKIIGYNIWWFGTCFMFPYIGNNNPN